MKKIILIIFLIGIIAACSHKTPQEKEQNKITNVEKQIFSKGDDFNADLARETLDEYEKYAKNYENDSLTPEYLFRASSLCTGLKDYLKALAYLQKIEQKYPHFSKSAEVIFQHAFILDNYLQDKKGAKNYYQKFLEKYPKHYLSSEAEKAMLYLDFNDKELIDMLESQNK